MATDFYPIYCLGENDEGNPVLLSFGTLEAYQQRPATLLVGQWWEHRQKHLADIALLAYKVAHVLDITEEEREQIAQLLWDISTRTFILARED